MDMVIFIKSLIHSNCINFTTKIMYQYKSAQSQKLFDSFGLILKNKFAESLFFNLSTKNEKFRVNDLLQCF